LFIGSTNWDHPIRNIHEIENVINTGIIRTENGYYSFWKENYFSIQDLINYLDDCGKFCNLLIEPMEQVELKYKFDDYEIVFETYALNIMKAEQLIKHLCFRKV
jgi:hypothetical protein